MRLTERQQNILQAIVEDYVATADPVGSRTIARKYGLGVSPATIRNEMADLEEMGLLEQPYTSAGRIPSDQGYRYYVDELMGKSALKKEEKEYILLQVGQRARVAEITERVTGLLSEITHLASLILGPLWGKSVLQQVRLLPLNEGQALLIIFTSVGAIEHFVIDLPAPVVGAELERVSAAINSRLAGRTLHEVYGITLQEIYADVAMHQQLVKTVLEIIDEVLNSSRVRKVHLSGVAHIIGQPEFRDVERLKAIFSVLEAEDLLYRVLAAGNDADLRVTIGRENENRLMQDCSLVTATYRIGNEVIGTIGILGPTRMEYARVVSAVEYVSQVLSEVLSGR